MCKYHIVFTPKYRRKVIYNQIRSDIGAVSYTHLFGMFFPIQKAAIACLNGPRDEVEAQRLKYQERRDALCDGLDVYKRQVLERRRLGLLSGFFCCRLGSLVELRSGFLL